jgi:hypothetical protein
VLAGNENLAKEKAAVVRRSISRVFAGNFVDDVPVTAGACRIVDEKTRPAGTLKFALGCAAIWPARVAP